MKSFELLICHLSSAFSKLILVVVYRSSSHSIIDEFFEVLLEIVSIYSSTVIICGDFSMHVDDTSDTSTCWFTDPLDAFNLLQHVNDSTHTQGHILDLIITQPGFIPDHINVYLPIISDHSLITCTSRCLGLHVLASVSLLHVGSTQLITDHSSTLSGARLCVQIWICWLICLLTVSACHIRLSYVIYLKTLHRASSSL